jgi:hypothetical protein
VKENVILKVFGADETEVAVFGYEHDFSEPTTLNAKSLFDFIVFVGLVHNGLGLVNRFWTGGRSITTSLTRQPR